MCRLSQPRIVYCVYGIFIYNIFRFKGTIFRYCTVVMYGVFLSVCYYHQNGVNQIKTYKYY